jgi:peptidoglycan hydrolase CwlO-like protein
MIIPQPALLTTRSVAPSKRGIGFWIGIGILISAIVFSALLHCCYRSQRRLIKNLQKQEARKTGQITTLTSQVTRLQKSETHLTKKEQNQKKTLDDLRADFVKETALWKQKEADYRHSVDLAIQREKDWDRERAVEREEVSVLKKEVDELRPRIGAQQDQIKGLRQELQLAKQHLEAEKGRNADLAKKVAFVTVEAAKRRLAKRNSKVVRKSALSRSNSKSVPSVQVSRTASCPFRSSVEVSFKHRQNGSRIGGGFAVDGANGILRPIEGHGLVRADTLSSL